MEMPLHTDAIHSICLNMSCFAKNGQKTLISRWAKVAQIYSKRCGAVIGSLVVLPSVIQEGQESKHTPHFSKLYSWKILITVCPLSSTSHLYFSIRCRTIVIALGILRQCPCHACITFLRYLNKDKNKHSSLPSAHIHKSCVCLRVGWGENMQTYPWEKVVTMWILNTHTHIHMLYDLPNKLHTQREWSVWHHS